MACTRVNVVSVSASFDVITQSTRKQIERIYIRCLSKCPEVAVFEIDLLCRQCLAIGIDKCGQQFELLFFHNVRNIGGNIPAQFDSCNRGIGCVDFYSLVFEYLVIDTEVFWQAAIYVLPCQYQLAGAGLPLQLQVIGNLFRGCSRSHGRHALSIRLHRKRIFGQHAADFDFTEVRGIA